MTAAELRVLFLAKLNLFRVSSSRQVSRLWSAWGRKLSERGGGKAEPAPPAEGRKLTSLMKPSCTSSAANSGMFSSDRERGEREHRVAVRGRTAPAGLPWLGEKDPSKTVRSALKFQGLTQSHDVGQHVSVLAPCPPLNMSLTDKAHRLSIL